MARKEPQDIAAPAEATKKAKKPKKVRWYHQVAQAYKYTYRRDKSLPWLMLAVVVGGTLLGVVLGELVFGHPVYWGFIGFMFSLLGAMFVLTNRFTKAQYAELDGEPGAVGAVLGSIKRGWTFEPEPVAFDAKTRDMVFRGIGRPGIVLVGEANSGKIKRLLDAERVKVNRVARDVPVTLIEVGYGDGQVPLKTLTKKVQKLRPKLNKAEVGEVVRRLSAIGGARLPIPKGVDPLKARPDRRGMR